LLQRLYDWTMEKAAHRHAVWWLMIFAFAEATFFPLPADILLIPMVIAVRSDAWRLGFLCAIASATGGEVGYGIGYFLKDLVAVPILQFYDMMAAFEKLQCWYDPRSVATCPPGSRMEGFLGLSNGSIIVAIGAISPIPYKAVTITSGILHMDFLEYSVTSYVTRMIRFMGVAGGLYFFGPPLKRFMDNNLKLATVVFLAIFVGGFVMIKYVV
jgi:membrane protein YqaA with SNARE-associated domain